MTPQAKRWIEAGKLLAVNPAATVRCPERDDGALTVRDVRSPKAPGVVERFMVCDKCGARNSMRLGPHHRDVS
jgi:hypothetical protein